MSFQGKLETIQYNAALAITCTIRGSSREAIRQELGLENLQLFLRTICQTEKGNVIKAISNLLHHLLIAYSIAITLRDQTSVTTKTWFKSS